MSAKGAAATRSEWPVGLGDRVRLSIYCEGRAKVWSNYAGKVVAVTPQVMVVDVGRYRVSVDKRAWWCGQALIQRI
jgi:hypothetical protein